MSREAPCTRWRATAGVATRELETVIERGAILSNGGKLVVDLRGLAGSADGRVSPSTDLTSAEVRRIEVANLTACLREKEGEVSGPDGAALLGLRPTTLSSRIKAYGITKDDWAGGG